MVVFLKRLNLQERRGEVWRIFQEQILWLIVWLILLVVGVNIMGIVWLILSTTFKVLWLSASLGIN